MDKRRTIQLESLKNQFGWKRLKYLFVVNTRKNAIFPLFVMFGLLVVFTIFGTLAYWFGLFDRIRCKQRESQTSTVPESWILFIGH